jgi:hypothetical protein
MNKKIYYRESWAWYAVASLIIAIAIVMKDFWLMTVLACCYLTCSAIHNSCRPKKGEKKND